MDTNPYNFRLYGLNYFAMYVNWKQIPPEGMSLEMGHEKTSIVGYKTLFKLSDIHHSSSGLQITSDLYIKGFFMLDLDLNCDSTVSEGHSSNPENGHIRIELKFEKSISDAITCLLYVEYDNSIRIDLLRNVVTDY